MAVPRVFIEVSGGNVTSVKATEEIEVEILDYDNMKEDPNISANDIVALETEYENLPFEAY